MRICQLVAYNYDPVAPSFLTWCSARPITFGPPRCCAARCAEGDQRGAGLHGGRGSFVDSAHPRLFGEFLDSAIDRLIEGVDLMLPHKLHEFAASVSDAVRMEDVPREFLSIPLNDHGQELSLACRH